MDDTTLLRIALITTLISVPVLLAISAQPKELSALSKCGDQGTLEGTIVDLQRKGKTQTVTVLAKQRVIIPADVDVKEGEMIRITGTLEDWSRNRLITAQSVAK